MIKLPQNLVKDLDNTIGIFNYSPEKSYNINNTVISADSEEIKLYQSLTDNNLGNNLSDSLFWKEISLGGGSGLEIGDISFAAFGIDETKNKRRYLNGQIISQTQFETFTNIIKERAKLYPNIITTEENWQAEVTNSKLGQCGKFVIDNDLGTIRLPKVVNIQGLQDLSLLGGVKAESLPNITGDFSNHGIKPLTDGYESNGAFRQVVGDLGTTNTELNPTKSARIEFNASLSNEAYQDNAPVQQEAIQYPYFIQVATGVEESVDVTREIELNNPFSLLDYKWSEYEITNASWLLSNGAFHSGVTYIAVYELLLKLHSGAETKEGVSVKLSTEAYEDTDFVINTTDTTFRLPVKVALASSNKVAGNGMTLGLTNGTDNFGLVTGAYSGDSSKTYFLANSADGYGGQIGGTGATQSPSKDTWSGITTDATKSGIETSSNGLKLYFYVGETIQDANVINASGVLTRVTELSDEYIVGLSMLDYSAGVSASSGGIVPFDGYIKLLGNTNSNPSLFLDGDIAIGGFGGQGNNFCGSARCYKGQTITTNCPVGSIKSITCYPFKGVN